MQGSALGTSPGKTRGNTMDGISARVSVSDTGVRKGLPKEGALEQGLNKRRKSSGANISQAEGTDSWEFDLLVQRTAGSLGGRRGVGRVPGAGLVLGPGKGCGCNSE